MNNAPTPDGRGQDRPNDAETFFPAEGSFNPVVPFSEIGHAPAPLAPFDPADVGKPAEAAWARGAHRAARRDEEETLVPSRAGRARKARPSWVTTAAVIALSVAAGLVSGTYLIRSAQRTAATPPTAELAAEAPAPAAERPEAVSTPEKAGAAVKQEEPAKVEKTVEAAHASKQSPPLPSAPAPRAERVARAAVEAREVTPAPRPTRSPSAPPSRPRPAAVARQTPRAAPPERTLPISTPPPTAKSKKVIQWP